MGFKNRNVRFLGLMVILVMLLSASVIGCCCLHGKGQSQNISICLCEKGGRLDTNGEDWPTGRFYGTVTSSVDGSGISGPKMIITGPNSDTRNRQLTGYYQTKSLIYGNNYTIKVSAVGYGTQTHTNQTLDEIWEKRNFVMDPYP